MGVRNGITASHSVQLQNVDVMSLPTECVFQAKNPKTCNAIVVKRTFYGYSPEVCNLPEVTSHLILKLDGVCNPMLHSYSLHIMHIMYSLHLS